MGKFLKIIGWIMAITLLFSGCSLFKVPEPMPTETPKTSAELLLGEWEFNALEDRGGNALPRDVIKQSDSDIIGALINMLSSNASIEFTHDGKVKMGVLSVNYQLINDNAIKLSGNLLPPDIDEIPVDIAGGELRIVADEYIIVLTKK